MSLPEHDRHVSSLRRTGALSTPFPFIALPHAIRLLRIGTAGLFLAHAVVRVLRDGSVASFGAYLERTGLPLGVLLVWLVTAFELIGGTLLLLGIRTRVMAAGFTLLLLAGIVIIHRHLGWFVGEHGSGGSEYSVALILALLVLAAADTPPGAASRTQWPSAD
ncbi:MAG: DoxX family protein [Gemmatimonadaceae bacterium]|nr:DoxX family protein [Gemmatimonadaceae bacterium]